MGVLPKMGGVCAWLPINIRLKNLDPATGTGTVSIPKSDRNSWLLFSATSFV